MKKSTATLFNFLIIFVHVAFLCVGCNNNSDTLKKSKEDKINDYVHPMYIATPFGGRRAQVELSIQLDEKSDKMEPRLLCTLINNGDSLPLYWLKGGLREYVCQLNIEAWNVYGEQVGDVVAHGHTMSSESTLWGQVPYETRMLRKGEPQQQQMPMFYNYNIRRGQTYDIRAKYWGLGADIYSNIIRCTIPKK